MRSRWLAGCALALLAAGLLSDCSSSSSAGSAGATPSTLRQVLDHVSDTTSTRQWLAYSRPRAAIAANGGKASAATYGRAVAWGNPLAVSSVLFTKALGFDPNTAELAVTAGNPPLNPGWLIGLTRAPDPKLLTRLGAKKTGSTYRFSADNAVNLNSPLGQAVPSAAIGFNVLDIEGTALRYGASSPALALLDPKSATLGADQTEAGIADCLGNPLAATITDAVRSSTVSGFSLVGVGVTGGAGDPPTDEMCVATSSAGDAQHVAAAVRGALSTGLSRNREQWSSLLHNAKVEVRGTVVHLTAQPADGHAGILLLAVQQQDLPGLSG